MNRLKAFCVAIAITLYISPAAAGPLATDPNVYTGENPGVYNPDHLQITFHGSSPFNLQIGPTPLEGYMERDL